jgi:hypothetical protein
MDTAQMMERLLATINANHEEAEANRKIDKEDTNASTKMLAEMTEKMEADQEKSDAARKADKEEMLAAMKANEEMTVRMDAKVLSMQAELKSAIKGLNFNRQETMACQEIIVARLEVEEPASVDMTPEVAHGQEVPPEDAEVMPVREPRKRRQDGRNLARCAARRRRTKTWTRGFAGRDRNVPRGKMGAEGTWSRPAEGRPVARQWHDEEFCYLSW